MARSTPQALPSGTLIWWINMRRCLIKNTFRMPPVFGNHGTPSAAEVLSLPSASNVSKTN